MDFLHQPGRIYAQDENGTLLAEILFPAKDGHAVIEHTFVDPSLKGQGVAGQLVAEAARTIREAGQTAFAQCAYAAGWFQKHPEEQDILTVEPGVGASCQIRR